MVIICLEDYVCGCVRVSSCCLVPILGISAWPKLDNTCAAGGSALRISSMTEEIERLPIDLTRERERE
jgi:hypothetical protein